MAIEFVCPSCDGTLQVGDSAAGRVIRCGGCQTMLRVPGDPASPGGPATPTSPFDDPSQPPPSRRTRPTAPANEEPRRRRRRRDADDEYDDRQDDRPRRPQGKAPPPSRNVFIWLVIIGGVLFIAIFGCCAGLSLNIPKEEWTRHESARGSFAVELPAKTRPTIKNEIDIRLDKATSVEGTRTRSRQIFVVIYRDIPSTKERTLNGRTDEDELADTTTRLLKTTDADPVPIGKPITADGFPGTELEFQGKGGQYTAHIIVADTRSYIVLTFGSLPSDDPAVQKFIESFTITDPKLVALGKERAKQEGKKEKNDKQDAP